MIEMRVGENHGVHVGGADRQWMPVARTQIFETLEQSAIDEYAFAADFEEMFGTGDRSSRAEEGQRHAKYPTCPPVCQNSTVCPGLNAPALTRAIRPAIAFAV